MSSLNGRSAVVASTGGVYPADGTSVQFDHTFSTELIEDSGVGWTDVNNATDGTGFVVGLVPLSVNSEMHV